MDWAGLLGLPWTTLVDTGSSRMDKQRRTAVLRLSGDCAVLTRRNTPASPTVSRRKVTFRVKSTSGVPPLLVAPRMREFLPLDDSSDCAEH